MIVGTDPLLRITERQAKLAPWRERADELSEKISAEWVNRTDVWGGYYSDDAGDVQSITRPKKNKRGQISLTEKTLKYHFASDSPDSCIGLHSTSAVNTCRWAAIDIDVHPDKDNPSKSNDPQATMDAALGWYERLSGMGFDPILSSSNGSGGYHLRVVFADAVPSTRVYEFIKNIVADWQKFGLKQAPEVFPKQAKLDAGRSGNWLRLPGKHPKRDHYSTFYDADTGRWLDGVDAVRWFLSHKPSDPTLVPPEPTKQSTKRVSKRALRSSRTDHVRAFEAMKWLHPDRADVYDDWLRVGMALHHAFDGSDDGLQLWTEWSEQNAKHVPGDTIEKWATFKHDHGNAITLASVIKWSDEDAKGELVRSLERLEGPIRNFKTETRGEGQKAKEVEIPLSMREVIGRILSDDATGNWPRRIGKALFVHEQDKPDVDFLLDVPAVFGWLQHRTGRIHWKNGESKEGNFVSRAEVVAELQRQATAYDGLEALPHYPPITGRYYVNTNAERTDGSKLRELVGMFSPATDIDGELILALCLSPFWGGRPGSNPMGCITSDDGRGAGKSTLAGSIANIAGGSIDVSPNEDISKLKERLLTPTALKRRVVLLDNLKALKFSWGEFEGLLTAPQINGRQLYVGDGTRPNNLTWIATLNGANFSEDIAQRAILIKIKRQEYRPTFADDLNRFIEDNRQRIVSDAIGILAGQKKTLSKFSRWSEWERDVLACVDHPEECQRIIVERQGAANVDREEAEIIENYVADRLAELSYNTVLHSIRIPSPIMTAWYSQATNDRTTAVKISRHLKQMADEGKLNFIRKDAGHTKGKSWIWYGQDWDSPTGVQDDITERINHAEKMKVVERARLAKVGAVTSGDF